MKGVAANRSTTCPESYRVMTGLLVNKVVLKILILRTKVFFRRFIIVRTKYSGDVGILLKVVGYPRNRFPLNDNV